MTPFLALLLAAGLQIKPISAVHDFVGHGKPTVLHFWATWCGACRDEFPALRSRLLALPAHGVSVELVSVDRPEDAEKAWDMLEGFALVDLPSVLLDAPQPEPVAKAVGQPHWDGTLPATFVYDAEGKLVRSFLGRIPNPAALDRAVRKVRPAAQPHAPAG
jgi:thiol-disulfide isomerase/thioredoxin